MGMNDKLEIEIPNEVPTYSDIIALQRARAKCGHACKTRSQYTHVAPPSGIARPVPFKEFTQRSYGVSPLPQSKPSPDLAPAEPWPSRRCQSWHPHGHHNSMLPVRRWLWKPCLHTPSAVHICNGSAMALYWLCNGCNMPLLP